jgi:hypothetical protein
MQPGPYAPVTPPPVPSHQVRPATSWYVVAGVVAAAGIVLGVVLLVKGIVDFQDRIDDFTRADLPATLSVEITDTGGYSIYHEYEGAYDDDYFLTSEPQVTVTDPSGDQVFLDRYDSSVTYSAGGHEGEGVFTFDADETGTYEVVASGEAGNGIAVGRGVGRGLVGAIVGGLSIGFVGVVAAIVIAVVVAVKRGRSRRALMPPPAFSGWGAPPPPGWGGPLGPQPGWGGQPAPGYGPAAPAWQPPANPPSPGPAGTPPPAPSDAPPPGPSAAPPAGPSDTPPGRSDAPPPGPSAAAPGRSVAAPPGLSGAPSPSSPPPPGGWAPPAGGLGSSSSLAVGVGGTPGSRTGSPTDPVADPPSLRGPVDWARSDLPLPWSHRRR